MMYRRIAATTLMAAAVLLAGCGGDDATARTDSGAAPAASASSGGAGGDQAASSPATPGTPIGSTRRMARSSASKPAVPIRVDVTGLRVSGELLELELVLTDERPKSGDADTFHAYDTFTGPGGNYNLTGVMLVDPVGQMLYLTAVDDKGDCVCSRTAGIGLKPSESVVLQATYAGVPKDLQTVDVRIVEFPTITGLRIQR